MTAIVEEEGVTPVVVRDQPVECSGHVLPSRNIPRIILIIGQNDHAGTTSTYVWLGFC
jgi:hypothetical protein